MGRLTHVGDASVSVAVDGVNWDVDLADIGVARLVPQK
jgi:hypothetical protein